MPDRRSRPNLNDASTVFAILAALLALLGLLPVVGTIAAAILGPIAGGFLLGRAMTSLQQIGAMKRIALPDLYGQLGLQAQAPTTHDHDEEPPHESA